MAGAVGPYSVAEGFPDQAMAAAAEAVAAARKSGHSFAIVYAVAYAGAAGRAVDRRRGARRGAWSICSSPMPAAIPRMEHWRLCFARVLRLRDGDEGEALIASFIEVPRGPASRLPVRRSDADADIPVPLPGAEPVGRAVEYAGAAARRCRVAALARRAGCRHGRGSEAAARPGDRARAVGIVVGTPRRHEPRAVVAASSGEPPRRVTCWLRHTGNSPRDSAPAT